MANTHYQDFQATGRRYAPRIPLPLLAFRDNHEDALPVQPGKIIKVWTLFQDERFVLVVVDGQEFHAFRSDLLECCDALPEFPERRVSLLLTSSAAA
jgi:hypothetical protein